MNLFARKGECHQLRIKLDKFVWDGLNKCKEGVWTHCYKSDYIIMERAKIAKQGLKITWIEVTSNYVIDRDKTGDMILDKAKLC